MSTFEAFKFSGFILGVVCSLFYATSCNRLPREELKPFQGKATATIRNDSLVIYLRNPLMCPLTIFINSEDPQVTELIKDNNPIILYPETDTTLSYSKGSKKTDDLDVRFRWMYGNPENDIKIQPVSLPFIDTKSYRVIQGYNGSFSHNTLYARYALDFDLKIGDTISSVASGYVVGVIEGYKGGGKSAEWKPFSNNITIYHPEMNLFSQYVHLDYNGSLVKVGDSVHEGQPIGISGNTGWSDTEHLHFNMLKTGNKDLESVMVDFKEGYSGENLKIGDLVIKE